MAFLTIDRVVGQELNVEQTTLQHLGKFFELHARAIDCLIRMVYWIPATDSSEVGKYKAQARLWLHSATHSFRAEQKLALSGYYLEAEIIGRHLVEVLAKMRYFHAHPEKLDAFNLLTTGKPAPVSFKTMFDEVMPGYYEEYKFTLSYPAHGGSGASAYRIQRDLSGNRTLDTGVAYKEFWATAFINWQNVLLLGYLRTYKRLFPELISDLSASEQQELNEVEAALEAAIKSHVEFKGGENSWHQATLAIWKP